MIAYEGPNAEQIRYWNEVMGPQWAALDTTLSAQIRPLGLRALERLALAMGERVIDIGCGCGETTVEIARRVGPGGRALGIDISEPLAARARSLAEGVGHVEIRVVDAQLAPFESQSFDALFSRFGVMFFADPVAAFSNLRRALRPGARVAFVCWRALAENPWLTVPAMAIAQHLPVKRPDLDAPGPFAFADSDRVRGILERAGFADVNHEKLDEPLQAGQSLDGAVSLLMRIGPAAAALREAQAGPELVETIRAAIRDAIAPFEDASGIRMPSASWVVTARRAE